MFGKLKQDAVLLLRGTRNKYSKKFLNYLKSEYAKKVIKTFGYNVEN